MWQCKHLVIDDDDVDYYRQETKARRGDGQYGRLSAVNSFGFGSVVTCVNCMNQDCNNFLQCHSVKNAH